MPAPERIAVVTGATAGIGLYTALGLARDGFHVVMVGRDAARLEQARRTVIEQAGVEQAGVEQAGVEQAGGASVETALADFASLAAVRALADAVLAKHDRLDLLVNNAGAISPRLEMSADGVELTIAVNHLAPFLLTNLLLDRLRSSAPARIVTVASQAHRGARVDPAALGDTRDWTPLKAYGRSKLCNIMFIRALAKRLAGSGVTACALHPGVVATQIGDRAGTIAGWGWRLVKPFLMTPEKGAATTLFLATVADPAPFHGAYVIGRRVIEPDSAALDEALAERLWDESARLVGL